MSTGLSEEICKKLRKPLQKYTRRGRGGEYSYCKGSDVVCRLNEAFNHSWSSEQIEVSTIDDQVLMLVSVTVYLDGDTISHQGYGSASLKDKGMEVGNAYKSAYTNALKKAAEQFGIGLGQEDEEDGTSLEKPPTPYRQAVVGSPPTSSLPSPRAPMESLKPLPPRSGSSAGNLSPRPASTGLLETAARIVNGNAHQEAILDTPTTTIYESPPTPTVDLDASPLTDTQVSALERLSKMRGKSVIEMITGGLPDSTKTEFKELLRKEAVQVIRYTNNLPTG